MSEQPKWTPGPWHVYEGLNFIKVGAEGYDEFVESRNYLGGPFCVANVEDRATDDYSEDHEKGMANARLIAAAPELYEALSWLASYANNKETPDLYVIEQALKALAKARGDA